MAWVINCECGFVVRGETEDEIVANGQQHAKQDHDMELTRRQVLAVAEPA